MKIERLGREDECRLNPGATGCQAPDRFLPARGGLLGMMRKILGAIGVSLVLAAGATPQSSAQTAPSPRELPTAPFVTTDQLNYAPGSTAQISGGRFQPGEEILLQVLHADGTPSTGSDHLPWTVMSDGDGRFASTWNVCTDDCAGSQLVLTAVGQTSGLTATSTFADGVSSLSSCPLFRPTVNYAIAGGPNYLAKADFNRDGKDDLAVAVQSSAVNNVSILLGNGDGTFQSPVAYFAGAVPFGGVATGDFNGDHNPDLVVGDFSLAGKVWVLLGNGNGTFQAAVSYNTPRFPSEIAVGDVNGDGKADLAVANWGIFTDNVAVLLGVGNGTFLPATLLSADSYPISLALADLNGDHKLDLVVSNGLSDNLSVLLGNGSGGFGTRVNYPAGSLPYLLATDDLNGDSKVDVAVASYNTNQVMVLLGNGNGTLQSGVGYTTGAGPVAVTIHDMDGDGKPDLAVSNYDSNVISVLPGNGDGTFQTATNYTVGNSPLFSVWGDFNGDGRADLAVVNQSYGSGGNTGSVSILLGNSCNAPPVARCIDRTVSAGPSCSAGASIDNGSSDPDAGDTLALSQSPVGPYPLGTTHVTLTVTDSHAASSQCQGIVTVVDDTPPSIVCPGTITKNADPGVCGTAVSFAAAASDNCAVSIGYDIAGSPITSPRTFPVGTTTVHAVAADSSGHSVACAFDVTVSNPNPAVTLEGPPSGSLYAVNSSVNFTATFTDVGGGTHTGTWMFDTLSKPATIVEPSGAAPGSANATYSFTAAGVYKVKLTINDSCGGSGSADEMGGMEVLVVVYDPSAGFVTGGGWINSPPGAYRPDPGLSGKASFGFVSKYQKGASVPTGETEFQLKVAEFNFHSSVYQWLVISGAKAQYKGNGAINGAGNYNFLLTATDGDLTGGGGVDKFRIKITDSGGGVVYDNVYGASDDINNANPQAVGGGSIVIHK